jgi:hypothetical protein
MRDYHNMVVIDTIHESSTQWTVTETTKYTRNMCQRNRVNVHNLAQVANWRSLVKTPFTLSLATRQATTDDTLILNLNWGKMLWRIHSTINMGHDMKCTLQNVQQTWDMTFSVHYRTYNKHGTWHLVYTTERTTNMGHDMKCTLQNVQQTWDMTWSVHYRTYNKHGTWHEVYTTERTTNMGHDI